MVKGAIPGSKGGYILVKDALKKDLPDTVPMPAGIRSSAAQDEEAPVEEEDEE
ncbi:MAG: 50S ribosomal protein L3, partial [Flavobacteriaceae bacterium]